MMSTTHAAMALTTVCLLEPVLPRISGGIAAVAIAGGVFPDLDIVFEHRKTLHHPEIYPVTTLIVAGIAILSRSDWAIFLAVFVGAAAIHSLSDVLGGGLGLKPWANEDQRGIFLHSRKRWIPPKRWIRYDGAPEDLLLATLLSIPPFVLLDAPIRLVIVVGLGISAVYVVLRKRLDAIYERICGS